MLDCQIHPATGPRARAPRYQHLAEQAGIQARGIARALNAQGSPDAGRYRNDSRNAFNTARAVHQQRQHSGAGLDRSEQTARVVEADRRQKQAGAQEAARGGNELTSEQRANASPETQQTLDRKERNDAAREVGMRSTDQSAQREAAPARPSKSGGRSR